LYHRNSGHTTDECQALKDKIDELIQVGHLRRLVQWAKLRSGSHEGKSRQDGETTLLREHKKTTANLSIDLEGRILQEEMEEGMTERSSTQLLGEAAPTAPGRNTLGQCIR